MKRLISFDGADDKKVQKRFEILYGGLIIGGAQATATRGIEVIRRESRILDALDAVSTVDPDTTSVKKIFDEPVRLVTKGSAMILDQPDFDLLKIRVETTPWGPQVSRHVVDTLDWFTSSPEHKPQLKVVALPEAALGAAE